MNTVVAPDSCDARPDAGDSLSTHPARQGTGPPALLEWAVPALFAIILLAQLVGSVHQLSQTADEATHLYAGYRGLKCGDFGYSPEHPPLAKMTAALPLLAMNVPVDCEVIPSYHEAFASLTWLYAQDWKPLLFRARTAVSVFTVVLCIVVWLMARRMFGFATALVAMSLLIFDPNLLANGALVTTDVVVTFALTLSVFGFYLLQRHARLPYLVLTGVAMGLTLVAKHSGIVVLLILPLLAIWEVFSEKTTRAQWKTTSLRIAGQLAVISAIAGLTISTAYGWRYAAHPGGQPLVRTTLEPVDQKPYGLQRLLAAANGAHVLPEAYLAGLSEATQLAEWEIPTFIAGRVYPRGQWFFYPLTILVKYPAPLLALMIVACIMARTIASEHRRELLYLLLPAGIFLALCMRARMNSGVRHILPILPFLIIIVAAAAVRVARRARWAGAVVALLVVLNAASSLYAFPNYLSYANELSGGSANVYKYFPWVDWGQAYPQVKAYVEGHSARPCWIGTDYLMDPRLYEVPCQPFGARFVDDVPPRMRGTVILSSASLTSPRGTLDGLLPLFSPLEPKARIGGSAMLVYEGDFDTSTLAAASANKLAVKAVVGRQSESAMIHARKAVLLAPDTFWAHDAMCAALLLHGELQQAEKECVLARDLLLNQDQQEDRLRELERVLGIIRGRTATVR